MTTQAQTGFGGRIALYLNEMFPLPVNVPISFFGFYGYYFLLQLIFVHQPLTVTLHSLGGAVTLTCFALLLRIFDEFKDLDTDRKLFPTRPVPSGRVLTRDLKILGWSLTVVMIGLNAWPSQALAAFLGLMTYALLSFKYFFFPEAHLKSLPLTLATHGPLSAASLVYVLAVFLDDFGLKWAQTPPAAWAGILMLWVVVLSWETSRKIRAPEMEDDYVTYSRLWGPRGAALVPTLCLTGSFALGQVFGYMLHFSVAYQAMLTLAFLYALSGFLRWFRAQTPAHSKLRPYVEAYSLLMYVALFGEFILRHGVRWQ